MNIVRICVGGLEGYKNNSQPCKLQRGGNVLNPAASVPLW